jgi:hypothetical protein
MQLAQDRVPSGYIPSLVQNMRSGMLTNFLV